MFKFGVYSVQQLQKGKVRTFVGASKNISVTLLDEIRNQDSISNAFTLVMNSLNDGRGAYKRTYRSRFDSFDDGCIELLKSNFSMPNIRVHDVAISSGETAVDFFEKLAPHFSAMSYLATDYDPSLTILRQRSLAVSIASDRSVVEILIPPFVFTPKKPDRWIYPFNRFFCFLISELWVKRLVRQFSRQTLPESDVQFVNLYCSQARALVAKDSRFRLEQHDILSPSDDSFECIRAMNVLNEGYFSKDNFQSILENFQASIEERGLLIVGSNRDAGSPVSGAIYARSGRRFELIWSTEIRSTFQDHVDTFNKRND